MSKTKNNSKRAILLLLLFLLLFGAVVLGILAWKNLEPIVEAEQKWQEIRKHEKTDSDNNLNWELLQEKYPDIVGWLYAPDMGIDYPVMQGNNNEYYLNHLPDKTVNAVGSLFLDSENSADIEDKLTVLYGHYVGKQQMLSALVQYARPDYYADHKKLYYFSKKASYELEVFAACETDPNTRGKLLEYNAMPDTEKGVWITDLMKTSDVQGPTLNTAQQIMALVTCKSGQENANRYIVYTIVKEQE